MATRASKRPSRILLALAVLVADRSCIRGVDRLWLSKGDDAQKALVAATPATPVGRSGYSDDSGKVDRGVALRGYERKEGSGVFLGRTVRRVDRPTGANGDFKVIARTSSFAFKGTNEDVRAIATKLGVTNVLQGSVRKAGNPLRITTQLIRASDGVLLWSESYDRKLEDVFQLQDEISTMVAKALDTALKLAPGSVFDPLRTREVNIEAYNLVLKGNYLHDAATRGTKPSPSNFSNWSSCGILSMRLRGRNCRAHSD